MGSMTLDTQHYTHRDFDALSFHDCLIYAIRFDVGDPNPVEGEASWRSRLILDIDYIAAWVCDPKDGGAGDAARFQVAPATLTFHDVGGLGMNFDYAKSGYVGNIAELSIHALTRAPHTDPSRHKDAPALYDWVITLNLPSDGRIEFTATGFDLIFNAAPIGCEQPRLPANARMSGKRINAD